VATADPSSHPDSQGSPKRQAGGEEGPEAESRRPGLDGVALLYIAGGIPAMVVFFLALFALTHACDLPA